MSVTSPNISQSLLSLLVSFYFGTANEDRAWFYEERELYPGQPGILGDLYSQGLIEIVDRTKQNILSHGIGKVKFGVTVAGEEVIKLIFLADPDRIIKACQSYVHWVPVTVTDVLRYVTNALRSDMARLPELLVSEAPLIHETAGVLLAWLREGQVMELVDMTSSNLVG